MHRIEQWLLFGGIQLRQGAHAGGVAGWLDADGRPEFLYLEIAGYYLTTAAWIVSGAASSPERASDAANNGRLALDWIRVFVEHGKVPKTRLYLIEDRPDWRNSAVFSFDLSMAVRGISCFKSAVGGEKGDELIHIFCSKIKPICSSGALMDSHALIGRSGRGMPNRWSTRPGPHHLKAAAAVLNVPKPALDEALR